jgi:hypothetical protein
MATITFLGEPQDIFDPGTAKPVAGPTTDAKLFCPPSSRPTTCRVTPDWSAGAAYVTLR